MLLVGVWAVVFGYFLLLWFATSLELAIAGSVIFFFFAFKVTLSALVIAIRDRSSASQSQPGQSLAANQNHPPR